MTDEPRMPMDAMEDTAPPAPPVDTPPAPPVNDTQEQADQRARDEHGRFAPKQDGQQPRGVPDQAARDRRLAQERDEARAEAERLKKRFEDMSSLLKPEGEQPKAELPAELKPLLEKIEGIDQRLTQRDQQVQEEQVWNQVRQFADNDEQQFRQKQEDFPQAIQHYIQSRVREMEAFGLTQEQAEAQLTQEAQQLLINCAQQQRSPAATMYAMAQARGYQPGMAPPPASQQQIEQPRPSGGRSFGTGAGPAGGAVTAAQIAAMADDDYAAFRATPEGQRAIKRAMMGAAQ